MPPSSSRYGAEGESRPEGSQAAEACLVVQTVCLAGGCVVELGEEQIQAHPWIVQLEGDQGLGTLLARRVVTVQYDVAHFLTHF
jgi:hypothetical protein